MKMPFQDRNKRRPQTFKGHGSKGMKTLQQLHEKKYGEDKRLPTPQSTSPVGARNYDVSEKEADTVLNGEDKFMRASETDKELPKSSEKNESCKTTDQLINLDSRILEMSKTNYKDPILDEGDIAKLELICSNLNQNLQVFILAVEILEEFIRSKGEKKNTGNWYLVMATCVLISSKHVGSYEKLDAQKVRKYLQYETGVNHKRDLGRREVEIMSTLDQLPNITIFDDINSIIDLFMNDSELAAASRDLTEEVLKVVFCNRKQLLADFKSFVHETGASYQSVTIVLYNRFYFPMIIFFTAIRLTKHKGIINIDLAMNEAAKKLNIPYLYWKQMSNIIFKMLE